MTDAETTDVETTGVETTGVSNKAEDLEERLVAEGEIAGDYLEELLDLFGLRRRHRSGRRGQPCDREHRRWRRPHEAGGSHGRSAGCCRS